MTVTGDDAKTIATLVAVVIALVNLVWTHFGVKLSGERRLTSMEGQLGQIAGIKAELEQIQTYLNEVREEIPKIDLFWDMIRQNVPRMLMHPNDRETDVLLEKLSQGTISTDEAIHLRAILEVDRQHPRGGTDSSRSLLDLLAVGALDHLLDKRGREEARHNSAVKGINSMYTAQQPQPQPQPQPPPPPGDTDTNESNPDA